MWGDPGSVGEEGRTIGMAYCAVYGANERRDAAENHVARFRDSVILKRD